MLDELDRAPEEIEFHQRRLAALPRHYHLRGAVRLQQLADVGLERSLGHPMLFVRVQRLLGQEEAIRAIDVARGPARLREQMKARRGIGRERQSGFSFVLHTFSAESSKVIARGRFLVLDALVE
jgi:hypothetical protein